MQLIVLILVISLSASLGIALGTNWNRFKNWLAKYFHTYYKLIIPRKDNEGLTTPIFNLISNFIDHIIENRESILKTMIQETVSIKKNKTSCISACYQTIPGLTKLEIELDVSNERKNKLKLKNNKITFWIIASGVDGSCPSGYEIWTENLEHLSDVYRVLTLFYRYHSKNPACDRLISFTRNFKIMNKRIQTETFKELSRHTRTSIREVFKSITKHLSTNDTYHKIIEIDQFNNDNNLSIELKRTRQLDQLVEYMNKAGNYLNSETRKFAACVKNNHIFFRKSLDTIPELVNFISFNQEKFGANANHINSLAIIINFKTFLRMRHEQVNYGTIDEINGINSISLLDQSFRDIVIDTVKKFAHYPFMDNIMLMMYLEYTILRNEGKITVNENSMDDIINMLEDPIYILGLNYNLSLNKFVELNPENLPLIKRIT